MYSETFLSELEATFVTAAHNPFEGLTKELFATFWGLTLYDIYVPHGQYETEITKIRHELTLLANSTVPYACPPLPPLTDREM